METSAGLSLLGANWKSSCCWQLIQTMAARFPTLIVQASDLAVRETDYFIGGSTVEPSVNTIPIVVLLK